MSENDVARIEARLDRLACEIRAEMQCLHDRVTRLAIGIAFIIGMLGLGDSLIKAVF